MKPKPIFYVDIPVWPCEDGNEWKNVANTETRREAEEFLLEHWGIKPEQSYVFITEGEI